VRTFTNRLSGADLNSVLTACVNAAVNIYGPKYNDDLYLSRLKSYSDAMIGLDEPYNDEQILPEPNLIQQCVPAVNQKAILHNLLENAEKYIEAEAEVQEVIPNMDILEERVDEYKKIITNNGSVISR
jgi:hypothetical protein